jgi:AI-2 transport protein TqsA
MKLDKAAYLSIILAFVGVVLVLAKDLLIPIVLAIFEWFIIREIRMAMRKIKFVRQKMPRWLENVLASLFLFSLFGIIISVVSANVGLLSKRMPLYEENVNQVTMLINETFNIDLFEKIKAYSLNLELANILQTVLNSVTSILGNAFIILIYVLFMLLEEGGFLNKMRAIYPERENMDETLSILNSIDSSVGRYLLLKTLVSFTTGILSFIVLKIIGVDGAFFWAFLIFVLNFIPFIGSLVAILFPTAFALLQFGEFGPAIWVISVIGFIQVLVGNFIEPKIMGNSLNLSPLIVIIALSIWGALWGIIGMIMSVPITVILLILLSRFPKTRPIAILLSEKGKLKEH